MSLFKHLKYASYLARHKAYVTLECFHQGLFRRGLMHDLSKLRPSEWLPYTEFFYGEKAAPVREKTGYYKPTDTGDQSFDFAWLLHQKRNDHHWQWWVLPKDDGGLKILKMSPEARLEMVCDWCGASRAQGYGGWEAVQEWYQANKGKMQLHPETRAWVESFLSDL